jgi:release factor glutamine methyltransferase
VRDWEPDTALFGRDVTAAVAGGAVEALVDGGALVLEVGDGQARRVAGALEELGYDAVRISRDLTGRERVVEGRQ